MPSAFRQIDASPTIFAHDFDNGLALRVVPTAPFTKSKSSQPSEDIVDVVSVQLWIGSGAAQEKDTEHGMAHFLEHLVFKPWPEAMTLPMGKGQPAVQAQDFAGAIEELGGDCNAYTSYDETVYYAHVPRVGVNGALRALEQSVFDPCIDKEAVALEREVVIEEILQYDDDPASCAQETLMNLLYPEHALGRPILGSVKGLRSYSAAKIRAFHRRHYQLRNALLVVSGPVRPQDVLTQCREIFKGHEGAGKGRRHPGRTRKPVLGALAKRRCKVLRSDVVETSFRLGYRGPALDTAQAVALDAAAVILGQGESARLSSHLLRDKALVSEISANFYLGPQSSTMQMALQCEAQNLEAASEALFEQIEIMAKEPCSQAELDRAQAQLESGLVYRRETVEGLAHATGWSLMVGESDEAEAQYFERLRALTPESIQEAVAQWMGPKQAALALVLPEQAMDAKAARALQSSLLGGNKSRAAASIGSSKQGGKGSRASKFKRQSFGPQAQLCELGPGFSVLLRVDPRVPMVSGQWLAQTGPYGQKAKKRSDFALLSRMLTRGTESRSALAMAQEVEGWAASLEGVCGWRSMGVYFEGLSRHMIPLLDRAGECMSQPKLAQSEWERERALLMDELNAEQDDLAHQCIKAMRSELYGKHPLASDRRGDAESVGESKYSGLQKAHQSLMSAPQVLSLCGDFDPEAVLETLQGWRERVPAWQELKSPGIALKNPRWPKKAQSRSIVKDRDQIHLAWGYPGLAIGDPKAPALEIVLQILGGQTGRLFMRMREQEALVYSVSASAFVGAGGGHICLYAATSADKLQASRDAIAQEVQRLIQEGPSASELERAKRSLVGQVNAGLQRRARLASGMAASYILGLDPEHNLKTRAAIESATLKAVHGVAKELLNGEALAKVELGPKGVV